MAWQYTSRKKPIIVQQLGPGTDMSTVSALETIREEFVLHHWQLYEPAYLSVPLHAKQQCLARWRGDLGMGGTVDSLLRSPARTVLCARSPLGQTLGYLSFSFRDADQEEGLPPRLRISHVAVSEACRRQGVASAMFEALLAFAPTFYPTAKKLELVVLDKNEHAYRCYRKNGFEGRLPRNCASVLDLAPGYFAMRGHRTMRRDIPAAPATPSSPVPSPRAPAPAFSSICPSSPEAASREPTVFPMLQQATAAPPPLPDDPPPVTPPRRRRMNGKQASPASLSPIAVEPPQPRRKRAASGADSEAVKKAKVSPTSARKRSFPGSGEGSAAKKPRYDAASFSGENQVGDCSTQQQVPQKKAAAHPKVPQKPQPKRTPGGGSRQPKEAHSKKAKPSQQPQRTKRSPGGGSQQKQTPPPKEKKGSPPKPKRTLGGGSQQKQAPPKKEKAKPSSKKGPPPPVPAKGKAKASPTKQQGCKPSKPKGQQQRRRR